MQTTSKQESIVSSMANLVSDGLQKTAEVVDGHAGTESAKIKDLQRNMRDTSTDQPITTDYGIRVSNTDNWLKIATDKTTGPLLLEDPIAREKGRHVVPL
jgi:catalase